MKVDKRAIRNAFERLIQIGLIDVEKDNGKANKYFLKKTATSDKNVTSDKNDTGNKNVTTTSDKNVTCDKNVPIIIMIIYLIKNKKIIRIIYMPKQSII